MNLAALSQLVAEIDRRRTARGFLSVEALLQLAAQGNTVLDPLSTLISTSVKVGQSNLFYPQVVLEAQSGTLVLGDENCLHPQTFLFAEQGQLSVGHRNVFGEDGVTFKTSAAGERLIVEDEGRYNQGATVLGTNLLGAGSQVLGSITVQGVNWARVKVTGILIRIGVGASSKASGQRAAWWSTVVRSSTAESF